MNSNIFYSPTGYSNMARKKISVIGAGNVGASVAQALAIENLVINGKAPGEGFCALYDYPRAQNVTMKVTLSLWISGKEISAPIYFYLVDTGATAE